MRLILNENSMKASELEISAEGKIPEFAVVRDVRVSYVLDAEGKKTHKVDFVRYDCANPDNYANFTIKVANKTPIVTKEMIEMSDEPIFIAIPVNEVVIKPYKIEYGIAKVSIIAPFVKLAEN